MSVHVITGDRDVQTRVDPDPAPAPRPAVTAHAGPPTWSLQGRLPLLICGLLASVVLAFGTAAYLEVRDSSIALSIDRLRGLARESLITINRGSARVTQLRVAAGNGDVERLLTDTEPTPAAMRAATRAARGMILSPGDTNNVLRLDFWRADGRQVTGRDIATPVPARDSALLARLFAGAVQPDSLIRSPMFRHGGEMRWWAAFPVLREGKPIGFITELRRFAGSPRIEQSLRRLGGSGTVAFVTDTAGGQWASLLGQPVRAPFTLRSESRALSWSDTTPTIDHAPFRYVDDAGAVLYATTMVLPGTPWTLVFAQPEAEILVGPQQFLSRLLIIGLVILLVGTVGAWIMSRHVTRPLVRLREAADAMAGGDYSGRVSVDGSTETAALAQAFNTMAEHTGEARSILQEQNDSLRRANEAKARFLAMMSHELRTPLNAIGGYTDLISLGVRGPTTSEQMQDLERIRRNKNQLLTLISDILQFSRLDAGQIVVRRQTVVLGPEFAAVRDMLDGQFATKGVTLAVTSTTGAVDADPARLHQILVNLLANALNATAPGGTVRLSADAQAAWTDITVADTGIGITPEMQDAIFEPFVQVDTSLTRPVGGTGLGLAIVRELATAMGGTVRVDSTVGVGSTFVVRLPTAASSAPAAPARGEGVVEGDGSQISLRPALVGTAA